MDEKNAADRDLVSDDNELGVLDSCEVIARKFAADFFGAIPEGDELSAARKVIDTTQGEPGRLARGLSLLLREERVILYKLVYNLAGLNPEEIQSGIPVAKFANRILDGIESLPNFDWFSHGITKREFSAKNPPDSKMSVFMEGENISAITTAIYAANTALTPCFGWADVFTQDPPLLGADGQPQTRRIEGIISWQPSD